jgi:hypothetical protein
MNGTSPPIPNPPRRHQASRSDVFPLLGKTFGMWGLGYVIQVIIKAFQV